MRVFGRFFEDVFEQGRYCLGELVFVVFRGGLQDVGDAL